jgi:hypothetical protein
MFLVGLLSWWYGDGFFARVQAIKVRLVGFLDFFSILILLKTLFAPYKQISAGGNFDKSETWLQIIVDKLISRVVGFFARIFLIIAGIIVIIFQIIFSAVVIIFWLILPLIPVAGLIMYVIGWVPEWKI